MHDAVDDITVFMDHTQCFFCDGTSRYGVSENLTTG